MKRQLLDVKLVTREAFHNQRSYEAALYAVQICNKMIRRSNAGDIIFEFEQLVKPEFRIDVDKDGAFTDLILKDGENCYVSIVGSETMDDTPVYDDGVLICYMPGKIYCTKREIREYFKLWRIATITNVDKVSDLTK